MDGYLSIVFLYFNGDFSNAGFLYRVILLIINKIMVIGSCDAMFITLINNLFYIC